jgi:hypothetical protein
MVQPETPSFSTWNAGPNKAWSLAGYPLPAVMLAPIAAHRMGTAGCAAREDVVTAARMAARAGMATDARRALM